MIRAQSAVVRAGDLGPGYRVDRERRARILMPRCPGFAPDRSDLTITGDASSFVTDGRNGVASYVTLFRTRAHQEQWWRRVVGLRYARCLARALAGQMMPNGIRTTVVAARALPGTQTGRVALFRIVLRHTRGGRSVDVYRDVALVADGRWNAVVSSYAPLRSCECLGDLAREVRTRIAQAR
jgi:hypothetical protein